MSLRADRYRQKAAEAKQNAAQAKNAMKLRTVREFRTCLLGARFFAREPRTFFGLLAWWLRRQKIA
jgi:hypothetical protein